MDELLSAIKNLISIMGLDNKKFAISIGLDPGAWSRKQRGLTKFTKDDLDAIVRVYPELTDSVRNSIGSVKSK
jgi:hypothetical protein